MPPLIVKTFSYISDHLANICVILTHSRPQFNSSSIAGILMDDDLRFKFKEGREKSLLSVMLHSSTMQWTSSLKFEYSESYNADEILHIISHLVNETRYFRVSLKTFQTMYGGKSLALICDNVIGLETLDLSYSTVVTIDDLRSSVSKLIHLRCLILTDVELDDDEGNNTRIIDSILWDCIGKMNKLEELDVASSDITSEVVGQIVSSSSPMSKCLRCLNFSDCFGLNGTEAVKLVGQLPRLEKLSLVRGGHDMPVSTEAFENLIDSALTDLKLMGCPLDFASTTSAGLKFIGLITPLKVLDLSFIKKFGDEHLKQLSGLPHLQSLMLNSISSGGSNKITETGVEHLSKISSLTSLSLHRFGMVPGAAFSHLSKLPNLKNLNVNYTNFNDEALEKLSLAAPPLEFLGVSGCVNLTESGLMLISKFENLKNLHLQLEIVNKGVSEDLFRHLGTNLKCLTHLMVGQKGNRFGAAFKLYMPHVKIF